MEKAKLMTVYMTDGMAICIFIFAFIGLIHFVLDVHTLIKWITR